MPPKKTYKVGDTTFDIPEEESDAFLQENPHAIEMKSFTNGKDTFDIPLHEVENFVKENPTTKPLYNDTDVKKKEMDLPSISSDGKLPVQDQRKIAEPHPIGENGVNNAPDVYLNKPNPGEERIKNLAPDLYNSIQESKKLKDKSPTQKEDFDNAIADANKFSDLIVGKLSDDGKTYINEKGEPVTSFKEGAIVAVPKKISKTGFAQNIKDDDGNLSWRETSAPDPSFPEAKESPTDNVTVTGYKELNKDEFQRKLENATGVKFQEPLTSTEDWQKQVEVLPSKLQEFSTYTRDNDKGTAIPSFLHNHPDVANLLNDKLENAPSSLETSSGRYKALVDAIHKTYHVGEPFLEPFKTNDPNALVDAPAFYKHMDALAEGNQKVMELQKRIDMLNRSSKYDEKANELIKQQKSIQDGLKGSKDFMQDPKNASVLKSMEYNEKLAQQQQHGYDLARGVNKFFPQMRANDFKVAESEMKADNNGISPNGSLYSYLNDPITAAYKGAKKALTNIGGVIVGGALETPLPDSIDPMAKKRREWKSAINEIIDNQNAEHLTPDNDSKIHNLLTHAAGAAGSMIALTTPSSIMNGITFGLDASQNALREASEQGMTGSDANQYALVNGGLMALLGFGLGGNAIRKDFIPPPEIIKGLLNPETEAASAKELSNLIMKDGLTQTVKETGKAGFKMAFEMKAISAINAINNQVLNKKGGYSLPENITDFGADIANLLTGGLLHLGIASLTLKGRSTADKEAAKMMIVHQAENGHAKEVLESLDVASQMPKADIKAIEEIKDGILSTESKNFPPGTTPEQKVQAMPYVQKLESINKKLETTDKEFTTQLNEEKKAAQEAIDKIMSDPKTAKKETDVVIKSVQKEVAQFVKPEEPEAEKTQGTHSVGEIGVNTATFEDNESQKLAKQPKIVQNAGKELQSPNTETVGEVKEDIPVTPEEASAPKEEPNSNAEQEAENDNIVNNKPPNNGIITDKGTDDPTSIKNEITRLKRKEFGLKEEEETIKKDFGTTWKEAKEKIDNGFDTQDLVNELKNKPRPISDVEDALLLHHQNSKELELISTNETINKASEKGDPQLLEESRVRRARILDELQDLYDVDKSVGRETARGLSARQMMTDRKYNLVNMLAEKRASNDGKPLTADQENKIEELHKKIKETQTAFDEYTKQAEVEILGLQEKVLGKGIKDKKSTADKLRDLAKKIEDSSKGKTYASIIPVTPKMIVSAMRLIADGIEKGGKLLDLINDAIASIKKDHPDQDENLLRKTINKNLIDVGVTGSKKIEKDYAGIATDKNFIKLRAENERAKNAFITELGKDNLSKRTNSQRVQDTFIKWQRAFKLSNPVTIGKLAMAGATRLTTTPLEDIVGGGYSKLFPKLAKGAIGEGGGFNIKETANAYKEGILEGMKDSYQIMRRNGDGKSDLDVVFGKGEHLPPEAIEFFGQLHSATKAPIKRAAFARSLSKRLRRTDANGIDISDPMVQTSIALDAYKDANRAIFMQDNKVADWWSKGIKHLEKVDPKTGKTPTKPIATVLQWLLPFVKVPTNIAAEIGTHVYGVPVGVGKMIHATFEKGIENLSADEKDVILRNLKKGSLGAAALTLGYMNPQVFGGYYQEKEKRGPDDAKVNSVKIFGRNIPAWLLESPIFQAMEIGATIRHVKDAKMHGDDTGIGEGIWAGALGLAEHVPMIDQPIRIAKLFHNEKDRKYYLGELAKSTVSPALLQKIADWTDTKDGGFDPLGETTKRKPETIMDHIKMGIPGLRKTVEEKLTDDFAKFNPKNIKNIEDKVNGKPVLKKLTDYGDEKVKEFEDLRNEYLKKSIDRQHGYLFVDKYGRYSITGEGDKKRIKIEDISNEDEQKKALKVMMNSLGKEATEKAKQKLFTNR